MQALVVIIDDDEVVLEAQKALLREMDVRVEAFRDPIPALEFVRQGGVELVITDLEMPNLDGLELLYRINTLPNPPRVMVLSAHDKPMRAMRQSSDKRASTRVVKDLTGNVFAILGKPFQVEEYRRLVKEALGHSSRPA